MNFFRIRQISTGLYFLGGDRLFPKFGEPGMRYEAQSAITTALRSIERRRPKEIALLQHRVAEYQEKKERGWEVGDDKWIVKAEAQLEALRPDNLEVVEFTEVEVAFLAQFAALQEIGRTVFGPEPTYEPEVAQAMSDILHDLVRKNASDTPLIPGML
jgi:hypothetical protein